MGALLQGVLTLGVGPPLVFRLVDGAGPRDCATLSRFWLSEALPLNSESRVLGVVLRALRRHTSLKFLVSYADPAMGHRGGIYQATGWLYTGLSEASTLIDLGDGVARHSRTVGHAFGTHSIRHFEAHDVPVRTVQQEPKHRYVYFIDSSWRERLTAPVLPYPKEGGAL
ncbi:MAG: DNA methyltransferase [Acidimicrobiia bacterium]